MSLRSTDDLTRRIETASLLIAAAEITDEDDGRTARLSLDQRVLDARADAQGLPDASAEAAAASPRVQRMLRDLFAELNDTLPPEARLARIVVATRPGQRGRPIAIPPSAAAIAAATDHDRLSLQPR